MLDLELSCDQVQGELDIQITPLLWTKDFLISFGLSRALKIHKGEQIDESAPKTNESRWESQDNMAGRAEDALV